MPTLTDFEHTLMHGRDWAGEDLSGYVLTEKMDGCRAVWTGSQLLTRTGKPIEVPADLLAALPAGLPLDMELWAGRGGYDTAQAATQRGAWASNCTLMAFDAPAAEGNYAARRCALLQAVLAAGHPALRAVPLLSPATFDTANAIATLRGVIHCGGEGLMAWHPGRRWQAGRCTHVLKLKAGSLELAQDLAAEGAL